MSCRPRPAGFSLIELLAVLGIASVLVAAGIPAFGHYLAGSAISAARNLLLGSIHRARSEAIRQQARTVACRSPNPQDGVPVCSDAAVDGYGGTDWAAGWIVFVKGAGTAAQFEPGDELILRQPPLGRSRGGPRELVWSNARSPTFSFDRVGLMGGTARTFRIDYGPSAADPSASPRTPRARCLTLNFVGRPRLSECT